MMQEGQAGFLPLMKKNTDYMVPPSGGLLILQVVALKLPKEPNS